MQIESIDQLQEALRGRHYVADRGLATAAYLALKLQRPLFLEGEPGVGKTEIAKVMADLLGTELIRLQCYEGLDVNQAVYEWNYTRQILHLRHQILTAGVKRFDRIVRRVRREREKRINLRFIDFGINRFKLDNRFVQSLCAQILLREFAAIVVGKFSRTRDRFFEIGFDARIIVTCIQIRNIPSNLFRFHQLFRRHAFPFMGEV